MAKRRSVMKHSFSEVPKAEIQRSSFDRSHGLKTTFDAGYLIPIFLDEALPGDTFTLNMTAFTRLATPLKPFMDNMFVETFFFSVPNRLVWEDWKKFNGEQDNPSDSTDFTVPSLTFANTNISGTIYDYFGLPVDQGVGITRAQALPFRAYNLIYNEWFRDQNIQDSVFFTKKSTDNDEDTGKYKLLRRGKRHDYFTSCLPWPQKGDSVTIPIGDFAPVVPVAAPNNKPTFNVGTGTNKKLRSESGSVLNVQWSSVDNLQAGIDAVWNTTGLEADLSSAIQVTINELRQGFQIQRLLERDARGGTRYTEIVLAHFGVSSPDQRQQRPEYLGGGSEMININPVAQTQSTEGGSTPQGNLAAIGTGSLRNHGFSKSFTEHCILIGLVNVRADITYQQGLDRMWTRQTRYDYYWPALAHLGEQTVLLKELFNTGSAGLDDSVFGYQERYAEYRYKPSRITGKFRSTISDSLDVWHLSQQFADTPVPTLSPEFIEDNPPVARVIAVQNEPHFLFDAYFNLRCARPMPLYGVPGLIDHF